MMSHDFLVEYFISWVFWKEKSINKNIIARNKCWKPINALIGTLKFFNIALSSMDVIVNKRSAIIM